MKILAGPATVLAFVGRHGTLIAAASIFLGLLVPPLAAAFKPCLGAAIVVMLTLAFLRVDPAATSIWPRPRTASSASTRPTFVATGPAPA